MRLFDSFVTVLCECAGSRAWFGGGGRAWCSDVKAEAQSKKQEARSKGLDLGSFAFTRLPDADRRPSL